MLSRHESGQVICICHDEVEPYTHDAGAFLAGFRGPGREGGVGRLYRLLGFRCAEIGHRGNLAAISRIVDIEARLARYPCAIDVCMIAQDGGVF
ncbi:hypothetical protein D3C81_1635680 [compost metagenome]